MSVRDNQGFGAIIFRPLVGNHLVGDTYLIASRKLPSGGVVGVHVILSYHVSCIMHSLRIRWKRSVLLPQGADCKIFAQAWRKYPVFCPALILFLFPATRRKSRKWCNDVMIMCLQHFIDNWIVSCSTLYITMRLITRVGKLQQESGSFMNTLKVLLRAAAQEPKL